MQIYQKFRNTVFGIAFNYTKSNADACDIVQEVFMRFLSGKSTFNDDEHIKAWLIQVTINECKRHLMSSWIKHTVSLVDQTIPIEDKLEDPNLFHAVMALPLKYRTPIHLHYYEGYSVSEIASLLGAREGTVKVRLSRARKMLNLADAGIVQELDLVHENDAFALKLIAFTGDTEIQKALFELKLKKNLVSFDEIRLVEKSLPAEYIEPHGWDSVRQWEIAGSKLNADEGGDAYYFNYTFPPYWMQNTTGDMVIRILGLRLYHHGKLAASMDCDFEYRFTPERSILPEPVKIAVNRMLEKDIYDEMSFTDDYENMHLHRGEVSALKTKRLLLITDIAFTRYKARVHATIPEEAISESEATKIMHQFIQPRFLTHHYWDGLDNPAAFELAIVENAERLRLFADGVELPIDEASLDIVPERGPSSEHPYYSFHVEYEGFDYEKAQTVEIRFGDEVIALK